MRVYSNSAVTPFAFLADLTSIILQHRAELVKRVFFLTADSLFTAPAAGGYFRESKAVNTVQNQRFPLFRCKSFGGFL